MDVFMFKANKNIYMVEFVIITILFSLASNVKVAAPYKETCSGYTISLAWNIPKSEPNLLYVKKEKSLIGLIADQQPSQIENGFRERFNISMDSRRIAKLKIVNVSLEDAGVYTCTATFKDGTPQYSFTKQLVVRDSVPISIRFVLSEDSRCKILTCTALENKVYLRTPDGRLIYELPYQLCENMKNGNLVCCVDKSPCCKNITINDIKSSQIPDVIEKSKDEVNGSSISEESSSLVLPIAVAIPCVTGIVVIVAICLRKKSKTKARRQERDFNDISQQANPGEIENEVKVKEETTAEEREENQIGTSRDKPYGQPCSAESVKESVAVSVKDSKKIRKVDDSNGDCREIPIVHNVKDDIISKVEDIYRNVSNTERSVDEFLGLNRLQKNDTKKDLDSPDSSSPLLASTKNTDPIDLSEGRMLRMNKDLSAKHVSVL